MRIKPNAGILSVLSEGLSPPIATGSMEQENQDNSGISVSSDGWLGKSPKELLHSFHELVSHALERLPAGEECLMMHLESHGSDGDSPVRSRSGT